MDQINKDLKCGYCKWNINTHCGNLEEHECFAHFDPNIHEFIDDQSYVYIAKTSPEPAEYSRNDNTGGSNSTLMSMVSENNNNETDTNILGNLKWTHEAILCLIHLYEKYINDFNSTKEKNDKIWTRLSYELNANGFNYTGNQCKFKFKYLKSKYMQKKDNMKSSSTGEACVTFRYFKEMDTIFGKKPNVVPVNLASNLKKRKVCVSDDELSVLDNSENLKNNSVSSENQNLSKQKRNSTKTNVEKLIDEIKKNSETREVAKKTRHEENMQFKNKLLETFGSKMDAMIDALKNN